jgi:hypothetical protein
MAVAYVQQADTSTNDVGVASGSSFSTLPANATVGHTLVLLVSPSPGDPVQSVSGLGTWSKVNAVTTPGGFDLEWWECTVTAAGNAITVTNVGGGTYDAYVAEFSGVASVSSGGTKSATSTNATLTGIAQAAGDAVLVGVVLDSTSLSGGPGAPWTDYDTGDFSWAFGTDAARQISTVGTALSATWTNSSSGYATAGIVLSPPLTTPHWSPFFGSGEGSVI